MQVMPSESPEMRLEREGDIGFVIASNPARMNAFTAGMWRALPEVLAAAEADPAIRVIVLRGAGTRAFSAGADISEFDTARSGDATTAYDALNDAAFRALSGCTKPTIAMIHGFCLGGGLAIALCTDIRMADEAAEFAIPAAKLGLGYNARWVRRSARRRAAGARQGIAVHRAALQSCRGTRHGPYQYCGARRRAREQRHVRLPERSPPTRRSPFAPPSARSTSWSAIRSRRILQRSMRRWPRALPARTTPRAASPSKRSASRVSKGAEEEW